MGARRVCCGLSDGAASIWLGVLRSSPATDMVSGQAQCAVVQALRPCPDDPDALLVRYSGGQASAPSGASAP
eukprot:8849189-Alexandrium_andersonii.AAC.1